MTININGVEFYSAQEVDARIREAIAMKDKKVDMKHLPIGTLVKVVGNGNGHEHEVGEILPITELKEGKKVKAYRLAGRIGGWVTVEDIEFVSFPEEEESTSGNGDEEDEGSEIKIGDRVRLIDADYPYGVNVPVETEGTVTGRDFDGDFEVEFKNNCGTITQVAGIVQIVKVPENSSEDDSEIKAGDIVIATEDELDITEGVEYEIKERETGTLYFLDDDGDIRYVNVHEEYLRKKTDKRSFKKGDIVYVNEEITDNSGDTICPGVLAEFILDSGVLTPDETFVVVGDGDIGKLTLVCRAEDRMDKSKEDE